LAKIGIDMGVVSTKHGGSYITQKWIFDVKKLLLKVQLILHNYNPNSTYDLFCNKDLIFNNKVYQQVNWGKPLLTTLNPILDHPILTVMIEVNLISVNGPPV
jgi:hypothetical protein